MDETIEVCSGKLCRVVMTEAVHKQFCKADPREQARCKRWMQRYADDGQKYLDREKFLFEDRLPIGDKDGTRVAIHAFKAWQLRVYGGMVGEAFVCTEIDITKKKNAADQGKLRSAAKKLLPFITAAGGGGSR